ncbi:hypothetical protein E2320_022120, partial [Naja naja]
MIWLPFLLLLLFWLLPPITAKRMQSLCVLPQRYKIEEYYHKPGDLIIGEDSHFFQLSIGFEYIQGDRRVYPSSFRINPKEFPQFVGLVQLLLYFQWNWVGFIACDSDNGERFISTLRPMLLEKEICLAFTQMVKHYTSHLEIQKFTLHSKKWANVEVILSFGDPDIVERFLLTLNFFDKSPCPKVWILTSYWKPHTNHLQDSWGVLKHFHGSLHLREHTGDISEFSNSLLSLDPLNPQGNMILPLWWERKMQTLCVLPQRYRIPEYYYRPGDLIIGGNLHLGNYWNPYLDFNKDPYPFSLPYFIGFEYIQGDQRVYSSSFRINPKEFLQFLGLVQLLLYFQWNWVGFIASESERGEEFISTLRPMLMEKEICLAFTQMVKEDISDAEVYKFTSHSEIWANVEVILSFGEPDIVQKFLLVQNFQSFGKSPCPKVWILTSYWKPHTTHLLYQRIALKHLHGSLHLKDHSGDISEFSHFLYSLNPFNQQGDRILPQ